MNPFSFILWLILIAMVVITVALLTAAYTRRRQNDRALSALNGYWVTVERRDGRTWSGDLNVLPTGFELRYPRGGSAETAAKDTSYILYDVEFEDLQAIYRDVEGLSQGERKRRLADAHEARLRGDSRETMGMRGWLDSILDALGDGISMVLGQSTGVRAMTVQTSTVPSGILVGYTGNRYDPLLERSLGSRVVCQMVTDSVLYERIGTLQAYSSRFLLLTDVVMPQQRTVRIDQPRKEEANLRLVQSERHLEIANLSEYPVLLDRLHAGEKTMELGMLLEGGKTFSLNIELGQAQDCELHCQVIRVLDVLAPRSHIVIRYRTQGLEASRFFDVGIALSERANDSDQEERLRWELKQHPGNAGAAAGLARLLHRRGDLDGAEALYLQALSHSRVLPDSGRRVQDELALLRQQRRSLTERHS